MNAEEVGHRYGVDAGQCLQMGSDYATGSGALKSMTACALRCASQQPAPPAFTGMERTASCSVSEAQRYGARVSTAPVTDAENKTAGRLVNRRIQNLRQPAYPPTPFPGTVLQRCNAATNLRVPANVQAYDSGSDDDLDASSPSVPARGGLGSITGKSLLRRQ